MARIQTMIKNSVILFLLGSVFSQYAAPVQERYIKGKDGIVLYTMSIAPEQHHAQKPVIIWLHGCGRHSWRYIDAMNYMASCGFVSIGVDAPGHGRSGGVRGHIESFEDYFDALDHVYNAYKDSIQGPLFVVGHSGGGLALIRYLQEHTSSVPIVAAIASAPGLACNTNKISAAKQYVGSLMGYVRPFYTFEVKNEPEKSTHNKLNWEDDAQDPLLVSSITARFAQEVTRHMGKAFERAATITTPLHLLVANEDAVVDVDAIKQFYEQLSQGLDKSITFFPGMYHSLFHELDAQRVYKTVEGIIARYLS